MSFSSIRVEGSLFSPELIASLGDETRGQSAKDFELPAKRRVRDEILEAWGDLSEQWKLFRRKRERLDPDESGTTETRRFWMEPFFATLGYELELRKAGESLGGRNYPISHRAGNRADLPIHIIGFGPSLADRASTMDRKPSRGGLSPHALVQEYINLSGNRLYGLATNGIQLRLIRDCGRMSRLSYVEFDLERMFEEELYSEFALLYRFLHVTRFSKDSEDPAAGIIESYHESSEAEGGRIRDGLSKAVEDGIVRLGQGFLSHRDNESLRAAISSGSLDAAGYYHEVLLLVYRILFLLVVEERGLVFPPEAEAAKRDIYARFYSLSRLRRLSELVLGDQERHDDWYRLLSEIFALFDEKGSGAALGIAPLGGRLFSSSALPWLSRLSLDNKSLKDALAGLDSFWDEERHARVHVNYGSLNVEEFGSVYEGLLELEPEIVTTTRGPEFRFSAGSGRGDTGSHYTPEELVQKLVKAGVDPAIADALEEARKKAPSGPAYQKAAEAGLLGLRILDSACGSGHMLLGAARRIGVELARVRTGEDEPSPTAIRAATRDALAHCVYGVDRNLLAVELCKVALWLEGHEPGKPLSFLDHRIRCGDSLAGLARVEELEAGIPDEAFAAKGKDDKKVCTGLKKRNAKERDEAKIRQGLLDFGASQVEGYFKAAGAAFTKMEALGNDSEVEAERKAAAFEAFQANGERTRLEALANIATSPWFTTWNEESKGLAITQLAYASALKGEVDPRRLPGASHAASLAKAKAFFHWFLEFPAVFEGPDGGFDVIIGNPPFLGGQKLSGTLGIDYLHYLTSNHPPAGAMDLVGFFFRRNFNLLRQQGCMVLIATKTIAEGVTREGCLDVLTKEGIIYWAYKSIPWPGSAAVSVSLVAIRKTQNAQLFILNGKETARISPYLDDSMIVGNPQVLAQNVGKSYEGSKVYGSGFVLDPAIADALIQKNKRNKDVLFPYLNGDDLNSRPDGSPSRWVINFFDWPLRRKTEIDIVHAEDKYELAPSGYTGPVAEDYPDCLSIIERLVKPVREKDNRQAYKEKWWIYGEKRPGLYRAIAEVDRVIVIAAQAAKYTLFSFQKKEIVFSNALVVIAHNAVSIFCLLSSSIHDNWCWRFGSTLKGFLRYASTDVFETFPFPDCLRPGHPIDEVEEGLRGELEAAGKVYYEERAELMRRLNLGLTKTYNLFHDPDLDEAQLVTVLAKSGGTGTAAEMLARILRLRDLHVAMDKVVLRAYGWSDLEPGHGFHDLDYLPENDRTRFTICDAARRTVLERLLELNFRRKAEEG